MSRTQVRGNVQIQSTTISNDQIVDSTIGLGKLAEGTELIKRDGSVAFTGNVDMGGNKVTNLAAPVNANDAVRKVDLDNATDGFVVTNEIPSGLINGLNTVFTTANTPNLGTVQVFVNGNLQREGAEADYVMSGNTITMNYTPNSGDVILVSYISAGVILGTSGNIDINSITGPLSVAKGGTGATTAQGALNSITQVSSGQTNYVLMKDANGNATWNMPLGVQSINGLTSVVQTLTTGSSGTDVNITSSGSTHTLNIPTASATATGLVNLTNQTFAGTKAFTGKLVVGYPTTTSGATLSIYNGGSTSTLNLYNSATGVTSAARGFQLASSGTISNYENGASIIFSTSNNNNTLVDRLRILGSGEVLLGYTTSNGATYPLQVNGQIYATSATIATSDLTYKENITTINDCLKFVNRLNPVSFTWKKHEVHNFSDGIQVGFLAQEVQSAFLDSDYASTLVKENSTVLNSGKTENFLGLAKEDLIPFLVGALKQLHADYIELERQLAVALKSN